MDPTLMQILGINPQAFQMMQQMLAGGGAAPAVAAPPGQPAPGAPAYDNRGFDGKDASNAWVNGGGLGDGVDSMPKTPSVMGPTGQIGPANAGHVSLPKSGGGSGSDGKGGTVKKVELGHYYPGWGSQVLAGSPVPNTYDHVQNRQNSWLFGELPLLDGEKAPSKKPGKKPPKQFYGA